MQKARCNSMPRLVLVAALGASLGFALPAHADFYLVDLISKTATPIDTENNSFHYVTDLNDAGQMVGWTDNGSYFPHAFITGPNGVGFTDLSSPTDLYNPATGINNAGQVVGGLTNPATGITNAFITGPNGVGRTNLGTLGGTESLAAGINATGQVAGYSYTATDAQHAFSAQHAFITGPNGVGMKDLGTLEGTESSATGINDAG